MNARAALAFCLVPLVCNLTGCIVPEDARPSVVVAADLASMYVHRGMPQVDNWVVQPSIAARVDTISEGNMGAKVWGNMDLKNNTGDAWFPDGHAGKLSEIDVIADYTHTLDAVTLSGGIHGYNLPNGLEFPFGERGATTEMFVHASTDLLGATPYVAWRYDFDEVHGMYALGGITEDFPIDEKWKVVLDGSLAYTSSAEASWNYGIDESGLADLQASVRVEFVYDKRTTLSFGVFGSTIIDDEIRDWFDTIGIDEDNVWVQFGVAWSL